MLVADLIDHELHCRKRSLVDVIFLPCEAKMVCAIPLSLADSPDWLFWPKTSSGTYSVKSGYKLLREVDDIETPSASDLSGNRDVWKQIWKLHVPIRIRTLLWRACCESLPSKVNLVRRKLLIDATCPNCSLEPETITHALWSCKKLDSVWLPQFAILKDATSPNTSFLELMHLAFKDPSCIETFANTMSLLWMYRNRVAFGEGGLCLEKIPDQARALVQEFNHLRPIHSKIPRTARSVRWKPPPPGLVKVNFDGTLFSTQSSAGLGLVVRDSAGLVLAALSQEIPLPTSVETLEVIAARRALLFAKELGFEREMIEGDSEIIINAIREQTLLASDLGHILEDIHVLSRSFCSISFHRVKRLGNCVAHRLARRSFCNPLLVWME
nr:putative ribonuclease h protein [Quercus suber]